MIPIAVIQIRSRSSSAQDDDHWVPFQIDYIFPESIVVAVVFHDDFIFVVICELLELLAVIRLFRIHPEDMLFLRHESFTVETLDVSHHFEDPLFDLDHFLWVSVQACFRESCDLLT